MVEFCQHCDSIIMGKKGDAVKCAACGKENKSKGSPSLKTKIEKKESLEIIDSGDSVEIHPLTDVPCPKCKSPKVHYWTKQTRSSDEPETQFFKCPECKHQWREYR